MPFELQKLVFNSDVSGVPFVVTSECLKESYMQTLGLMLVSKSIKEIVGESANTCFLNLKKIHVLLNKYHAFNDDYRDSYSCLRRFHEDHEMALISDYGNPQLVDAIATGIPYPGFTRSLTQFSSVVLDDIKDIMTLTPQSLHCPIGISRCFHNSQPLFFACINENIPLEIIEFLIVTGLNTDQRFPVQEQMAGAMKSFADGNVQPLRANAITELFAKHGCAVRK